jgi:hypothetical protein
MPNGSEAGRPAWAQGRRSGAPAVAAPPSSGRQPGVCSRSSDAGFEDHRCLGSGASTARGEFEPPHSAAASPPGLSPTRRWITEDGPRLAPEPEPSPPGARSVVTLTVPPACHKQRAVSSRQPRSTQRRPGPVQLTAFTGHGPARSGLGSRGRRFNPIVATSDNFMQLNGAGRSGRPRS